MTAELIGEVVVVALALSAAWLSMRPSTPLEWERLWKVTLATVIRGDVEASGQDQDEWWSRLSVVPYHPAGRRVYSKLFDPKVEAIPVPALEGERALVDRLSTLDDSQARFEYMYRASEAAQEALMSDPAELGPAYDPSAPLAPGVDWQAVASWDVMVQAAVARRLSDVVVAVVGTPAAPLVEAIPHADVHEVESLERGCLLGLLTKSHQRLAIVAAGEAACGVLDQLQDSPALRDRLVVFVSLGAPLQVGERRTWMEEHFQHKSFDTELNRRTLYMAISDPGDPLEDTRGQRFPDPPVPPSGWAPIESVDLGILPLGQQDPILFARALWVLLAFCFHSR